MDPLELIAQAEKKTKPTSWFGSLLSDSAKNRHEEASDYYTQAANAYKLQKNLLQAGKTFELAAKSAQKAESPSEAGNLLVEAYKAYKSASPADAARCLSMAIQQFTSQGQFRRAANNKCDLAELYLSLNEKDNAIKSFEDAGDWYASDSAESLSNKCFLRSADLKAEIGQYVEASELYESIAQKSLTNPLSRFSLKNYVMKAVLCRLAAGDYAGAVNKLELFVSWDRSLGQGRDYDFLNKILDGVKDRDPDVIGAACAEYDQYSRLDNWMISILTKIKDTLGGSGGAAGAGDLDEDDLT